MQQLLNEQMCSIQDSGFAPLWHLSLQKWKLLLHTVHILQMGKPEQGPA